MAVYTSLPADEQTEAFFPKMEHTDLAHFHIGQPPALQRWQHLVGISENAVCRLCGEEVSSAGRIWLRCPALLAVRHHSDLGHVMDEPGRLPRVTLGGTTP